jgi:hypothetical protein
MFDECCGYSADWRDETGYIYLKEPKKLIIQHKNENPKKCKHDWLTNIDLIKKLELEEKNKDRRIAILSTSGKWCSLCGASYRLDYKTVTIKYRLNAILPFNKLDKKTIIAYKTLLIVKRFQKEIAKKDLSENLKTSVKTEIVRLKESIENFKTIHRYITNGNFNLEFNYWEKVPNSSEKIILKGT